MTYSLNRLATLLACLGFCWGSGVQARIDGKTALVKIYRIAVSVSPSCTDPLVIYANESAKYVDMLSKPVFGNFAVANGSYACVIIEMSDTIKVTPAKNSGPCSDKKEVVQDICAAKSNLSFSINNTVSGCADGEQRVAIYLSTAALKADPSSKEVNPFLPPKKEGDANNGLNLPSAWEVHGNAVGTLVISADGRVNDQGPICSIDTPAINFRFY